jgi:hypothetical protein
MLIIPRLTVKGVCGAGTTTPRHPALTKTHRITFYSTLIMLQVCSGRVAFCVMVAECACSLFDYKYSSTSCTVTSCLTPLLYPCTHAALIPAGSWLHTPACASSPFPDDSVADSHFKVWGWDDGHLCAYKDDQQRPTPMNKANNRLAWADAPACTQDPEPTINNAVPDRLGCLWGWQLDRSDHVLRTGILSWSSACPCGTQVLLVVSPCMHAQYQLLCLRQCLAN